MNSYLWFAVYVAAMAVLLAGYMLIMRRHQRSVRETIRQAAVCAPTLAMNTTTSSAARSGFTFACPHFSVGNVRSASCGICGPLPVAP